MRGRVLTLIKNISLVLRLQGSYLRTISLQHSKEKRQLEIPSYDPFYYLLITFINLARSCHFRKWHLKRNPKSQIWTSVTLLKWVIISKFNLKPGRPWLKKRNKYESTSKYQNGFLSFLNNKKIYVTLLYSPSRKLKRRMSAFCWSMASVSWTITKSALLTSVLSLQACSVAEVTIRKWACWSAVSVLRTLSLTAASKECSSQSTIRLFGGKHVYNNVLLIVGTQSILNHHLGQSGRRCVMTTRWRGWCPGLRISKALSNTSC